MADKVIWHTTMSLDGYIADRDGSLGWAFGHDGSIVPSLAEIMATVGAVLIGRRLYDQGATTDAGARLYGGAYTGPVYVLTHHQPEAREDPAVRFVTSGVRDAIAFARAGAAGQDVLVMGGDVATQCLLEGLVDELLVHQVPVLLGDGVRLFGQPGGKPAALELLGATPSGQILNLRFRVKEGAALGA